MDKNAVLMSYDLLPILKDFIESGNPLAAAELAVAVIEYDKDNTEPTFTDDMVAFAWRTMVKPKLDEYRKKYEERANRNRKNGEKGGRPPKDEEITQETHSVINNPENPVGLEKPNLTPIDKISIDKIREDKVSKEEIREELFELPPKEPKPSPYSPIIEAWNQLPIPRVTALNGVRLKLLQTRIHEYSIDDILRAIDNIGKSPFLLGHNDRGWKITFDWFVKPNNFPKVLEGNYLKSEKINPRNDVQAGYEQAMRLLGGVEDG